MTNHHAPGRVLPIALVAAAALATAMPAFAETVSVPTLPDNLVVDDGFIPYLVGHAQGTQNYVCLPTSTGVAFTLFTPEALLSNDDGKQLITHFFSPNPYEPNTNPTLFAVGPIRATWQHSKDSSSVWAQVKLDRFGVPESSTDPRFVAKGAVAWLKLTAVGNQDGPDGAGVLSDTKFVLRVNTAGGVAPRTGCSTLDDVGHLAFVPYTADYFFFRAAD